MYIFSSWILQDRISDVEIYEIKFLKELPNSKNHDCILDEINKWLHETHEL